MIKTKKLRDLINGEEVVVAPCAYDALSARAIEFMGFELAATTGFGMHGTILGVPDNGLLTFTEMVRMCRNMAAAVKIPMMADAEGGYGNAINTYRTVVEFQNSGIAGLFIEDQELPPNCPYIKGTKLIRTEEMIGKIKAAVEARKDENFVIVARTDAPFEEAIERLNAYAEAGADMVKPMPRNKKELEEFPKYLKSPIHLSFTYGKETTIGVTAQDCGKMGYKIVTFPFAELMASATAMLKILKEIKEKGTDESFYKDLIKFDDYLKLVNIDTYNELDRKYMLDI